MTEVAPEGNRPPDSAHTSRLPVAPETEERPTFSVVPDPAEAGGDLRKLGVLGGVLALVSVIALLRKRRRAAE